MNKNKILIVSFKLGTSGGVGGRRWLLYGLELLKNGHDVFFLTYEEVIPLELEKYKGRVFFVKSNYPKVLKSYPKSIVDKLIYRFWTFILGKIVKGTIYDEAVRSQTKFMQQAESIVLTNNITHVITSGAPFSLLYFGTLIKKKFPQLHLASDYRDSWTEAIGYGIKQLNTKKFQYELNRELEVLKISDKILVASKDVGNLLLKIDKAANPIVITNFMDSKQFSLTSIPNTVSDPNKIVFTHIGTVNIGTQKYWKHFFELLTKFQNHENYNLEVQFIGLNNKEVVDYVNDNNLNYVTFLPKKTLNELTPYLMNSDMLFFFKHDDFPDSFPTKFFDYILFNKPLICFSLKGDVTNEIEVNDIGCVFNENTDLKVFTESIVGFKSGNKKINSSYNTSKYSVENQTLLLEKTLELNY